jgi:hypothetical protein
MTKPPATEVAPLTQKDKSTFKEYGLAIAALLAPTAYLVGYAFNDGYTHAFGIGSETFPVPTPTLYVFSFQTIGLYLLSFGKSALELLDVAFTPPALYWVIGTLLILVLVTFCALKLHRLGESWATEKSKRSEWKETRLGKLFERMHWKSNDLSAASGLVFLGTYGLVTLLFMVAAIAVCWWVLPLMATAKGKELAQEEISAYLKDECHRRKDTKWSNCHTIRDSQGNTIQEGLLVGINGEVIAIFNQEGLSIIERQGHTVHRQFFALP